MSEQTAISLSQLTPEQIAELRKQMKAEQKQRSGDRESWNKLVDKMLQERTGTEFNHSTGDILAALQADKIVSGNITGKDRAAEIKRIQTRKQLLEKKVGEDGKPLYTVGYKPSANGFLMSLDRVIAWAKTASRTELSTLAQCIAPLVGEQPSKSKKK
jgi:hypothetical protein